MNRTKNYDHYRFVVFDYVKPRTIDWSTGYPYHTLIYVRSGHGYFISESVTMELNTGDFYYVPMGLAYKCHWKTPNTKLRSMGFRIFPDCENGPFMPQQLPKEFIEESLSVPVNIQPDVYTLGKFYTLLAKLVPLMQRENMDKTHKLVAEAKNWMSTIFMRGSIAKIAACCEVSESTLYDAFRSVEGKTPNEVRREIVVAEAVRVLEQLNTSIGQLSEHLGFSSDTYFRKVIKDTTGLSPREIRKRAKAEMALYPENLEES